MSTTHERSFAGLVMAHLAVTLVVCGGLVLLQPAPALSQGLPAAISPIAVIDCDASARSARDQVTAAAGRLSAPDSDAADDDDDAPNGPDAAITVDHCGSISDADVLHVVHVKVDAWISRSVDGHSLRGPPSDDDDTSSDADFDGDDNDPTAELSVPLPPPSDGESCPFTLATFVGSSSVRSTGSSLRAPPFSFSS